MQGVLTTTLHGVHLAFSHIAHLNGFLSCSRATLPLHSEAALNTQTDCPYFEIMQGELIIPQRDLMSDEQSVLRPVISCRHVFGRVVPWL